MSRFLSQKHASLEPYTPGEQPRKRLIKLNTNESPFPPPAHVVEAAEAAARNLQLYCDPECKKEKRLYNSDKLWDFVVYEAEAFLGAADRGSLGKFSSVAENSDIVVPGRPIRPV